LAVRIRLKRIGRRGRPFFRVIAIDSRRRRDGAEIERLGWYDPLLPSGENFQLNEERILHWLGVGAQPSTTARNLFTKSGIALRWHLIREGKSADEVQAAYEEWRALQLERERRKEALMAQKKRKEPAAPEGSAEGAEVTEVEPVRAEAIGEAEAQAAEEEVPSAESAEMTAEEPSGEEEPTVVPESDEEVTPEAVSEPEESRTGEAVEPETAEEPETAPEKPSKEEQAAEAAEPEAESAQAETATVESEKTSAKAEEDAEKGETSHDSAEDEKKADK
jgi:small subunit ribosomal protein S16